jgi:hypothetical protein
LETVAAFEVCLAGFTFVVDAGLGVSSSSISRLLYEQRNNVMIRSM